eukprot:2691255-Rhodomonas_salina.1
MRADSESCRQDDSVSARCLRPQNPTALRRVGQAGSEDAIGGRSTAFQSRFSRGGGPGTAQQ